MGTLPIAVFIAGVGVTIALLSALYTAALRRKSAEIELLTAERDAAERRSSATLRKHLKAVEKRIAGNDQIFADLATAIAEMFLVTPPSKADCRHLSQESKLLLREFLFFSGKERLKGDRQSAAELGKTAVMLLDAFEEDSVSRPRLGSYVPRMRAQSDHFYVTLPEVLDQGTITENLPLA